MIRLTVILPTRAPDAERLRRTLEGLRAQNLPASDWELVLIDNASPTPVTLAPDLLGAVCIRVVRETRLGLTFARRRGFAEAKGEICVLVDDDNVLAPTYLADVIRRFAAHPEVGVMGGPSRPEFSSPLPEWAREFLPLLALRDFGPEPQIARLERASAGSHWCYPASAPIGAGLALRTVLARAWAAARENPSIPDRIGSSLTSGGDNDIVLHLLRAGHASAYFPELSLTHLIPPARLEPDYLARLNRGIQKSWMQVLTLHDANPWPPLSPLGARLRQWRAWFTYAAWQRPAGHIRWSGAAGHFAGRVPPPQP